MSAAKKYYNRGFASRHDGHQRATKIYTCVRCENKTNSPKPKTCIACGYNAFLKFDSKIEFLRYQELVLLEKCGHIRNLQSQVTFRLKVNSVLVTKYIADSMYFDIKKNLMIVEDVKPKSKNDAAITEVFKLKAKLFAAIHGFNITIERR